MKKSLAIILLFSLLSCDSLQEVISTLPPEMTGSELTQDEVVRGLKEALQIGFGNTVSELSVQDGFRLDTAISIPFMQDAQEVEKKLRDIGLGNQVDKFVLRLNRAAEDASAHAGPIFEKAISEMSFSDVWGSCGVMTSMRLRNTYGNLQRPNSAKPLPPRSKNPSTQWN